MDTEGRISRRPDRDSPVRFFTFSYRDKYVIIGTSY